MNSLAAKFNTVCMLVVLLAAGACKTEPAAHPAEARAGEFLDALKYGDARGAAALHVESTAHGFYCESPELSALLERARQERTDAACERLQALDAAELDTLAPAERGMVQIVRFVCEEPSGGCAQYGARVFESHLVEMFDAPRPRLRGGDWTIQRVVGDAEQAVIYVDLRGAAGSIANETLTMRRIDGVWYVAQSPADESYAAPSARADGVK